MSCRITVKLPILDYDCLVQALEKMKLSYQVIDENKIIITHYHRISIERKNNQFNIIGEDFLINTIKPELIEKYQYFYNQKLLKTAEEEKRRLEEERKRYIETQKQAICEKAKRMGYSIKESNDADSIRLVLVRRVYD